MFGDAFDDVLLSPFVAARQIGMRALSPTCSSCPVKTVCGGGHYAHRYRDGNGFLNPSVYCSDLLRLIMHIRSTVAADLPGWPRNERHPMEIRYHRPPADTLRELSTGGGGAPAMRMLGEIQTRRHLLLVRGVLETAHASGGPGTAGRVQAAYRMLADLQVAHPEAVRQVICHPAVGAWAGHAIRDARLHRSHGGLEQLGALVAAAAIRAGARATMSVPVADGQLMLPSLGMAVPGPASCATVRVADGDAVVEAPAPGSRFPPIRAWTRPAGSGCAASR